MKQNTFAVFVLSLLCTYPLFLVLVVCPAIAIPSSNFISVDYQSQETGYYCGPACVQMALSYLSDSSPSQSQLASEMQTIQVTYTDKMRIPFDSRGFTSVYEEIMNVDGLKTHNSNGNLVIILIYFSTAHQYQHYVLVVGYDSDGIYVHDPWPIEWQQPAGRTTGANASISNSLLADLWNCNPPYWGLVVPSLGAAPPLQPTPWWIQYRYFLIAIPVAVVGVVVAIIVARRRKMRELPPEISPPTPSNLVAPYSNNTKE